MPPSRRSFLAAGAAAAAQPGASARRIRPFRIRVDADVLADLRHRLDAARWPEEIPGSGWDYGVDRSWLRSLVDYWRTGYDWREQERRLNRLPQFVTTIDGIDLHFVHARSPHRDAVPLVLVHGWPGSFFEFHRVIEPLTVPERHGGTPADAFHVICPSLPGFAFSSAPRERGWSSVRMAECIGKLMARLACHRYLAQGGDWGSGIVRWLASNDGGHCLGAHSNFPGGSRPAEDPWRDVTDAERERLERRTRELNDHRAYAAIQGTRPQTLAYALNDSPVGLAAWVLDKFWAWSDHGGTLESSFSRDDLLTNVMLYWVTGSMPSACRIYFESSRNAPRPAGMSPFQASGPPAPVGYALFPKEINVPPRAWVERGQGRPLFHWTEMPRGGHFAALEQPGLLVDDIRLFARKVREQGR